MLLCYTLAFPVPGEERRAFEDGLGIKQLLHEPGYGLRHATSQVDTIYVGYLSASSDPNGIGVGGVWDFDTDVSGTDSTQFWQFFPCDWRFESTTALPSLFERPSWYFDYGNEVNIGDTNLWIDREVRGDTYRRTGITGVWHVDGMAGVSSPISGSSSGWCGLRGPSDVSVIDELTGNPINADVTRTWAFGGQPILGSYPGYSNQMEQILYRDVAVLPGDDILSFRFRTDLSESKSTETNGSAWFNPNPTTLANYVFNPVDSLMVWVGVPREDLYDPNTNPAGVYDSNRRWLSDVIDFNSTLQPAKLFAQHGKAPLVGPDTTVTVILPELGPSVLRIAFQIKTNRQYSDESYGLDGYDSIDGAALIDDVILNGETIGDFESPTDIRPRLLLDGAGNTTEIDPLTAWITTGRPPASYAHIHNLDDLPFLDPCGFLDPPGRLCDVTDNALLLSNHDDVDHRLNRESWVGAESPTIDLSPGSPITQAGVGSTHNLFRLEYQLYTGEMDLDRAVFWNVGARYHGPTFLQQADELVPGWSPNITASHLSFVPDQACRVISSGTDLDGLIPPPSQLDSMKVLIWMQTRCSRFGATVLCGLPGGGYFDNIRACFTAGKGAGVTAQPWDLLQDTFPFNENVQPGSSGFDSTTALIKSGINIASAAGDEGVVVGDSMAVSSPFTSGLGNATRVDLVFRIWPGPGNYSAPGNMGSPLIEKDPVHPFWQTYQDNPGPFGKGIHPVGGWDPTTWNSARMDSADNLNLSPLVGRNLGIPVHDMWHGTLHESDPNHGTLGIPRDICFLVDPTGSVDNFNICCSAAACGAPPFSDTHPPGAYPGGTQTTTTEGTKILPDGYFSPGTHIEYFVRRSDAPTGVTNVSLSPDTTVAFSQPALGPHADGQRFLEIGVLPDLWKDIRFGGAGLACMLIVDAGDRRGQEHTISGALDSLGFGKNTGAGRGWKEDDPSTSNPNPDDPDNWVYPNLGQKGLSFDWFDINAAESAEGGRPGCRLAPIVFPQLIDRQCKQGPTPLMLKTYYNTVLWMSDNLEMGVLHDGIDSQEQSSDVELIRDYLATSDAQAIRAMWLAGDGAANDLANSLGNAPILLANYFGTILLSSDPTIMPYNADCMVARIPQFRPPRLYGLDSLCIMFPDIIYTNPAVTSATLATYAIADTSYGMGVYNPANLTSQFYTTLLTSHQVPSLRDTGCTGAGTDAGRILYVDHALTALGLCPPSGTPIAVGDVPGVSGAQLSFVRGAFPNPSINSKVTVEFNLAQDAEVLIRLYNIVGRLVHETRVNGTAGSNRYRWDGRTSRGPRAAPGVYFYRLSAPGIEFRDNDRRMILLGGAAR
jgi:hypothetical protein